MSAGDLRELDNVLALVEFLLVAAAVMGLINAVDRMGRAYVVRTLILAAFVGLTVAQPFGVKGIPISPEEYAAGNPQPADPEEVHTASLLGVPLFGFQPYTKFIFRINGEGGDPTDWLKVRSWLWPGLLTNGGKVVGLCGTVDGPCWETEDPSRHRTVDRSSYLELVEADGEWRYRILTFEGDPVEYPPPVTRGDESNGGYYRLAVGVASISGLVYWVFAVVMAGAIIIRGRRGGWERRAGASGWGTPKDPVGDKDA